MGLRNHIVLDRPRIDDQKLDAYRQLSTSAVGDVMDKLACMRGDVQNINGRKLCGRALTVRVPDGDNLMLFKAILMAEKDDVIVVNGNGFRNRALFGEMLMNLCISRKAAGIIIDGAVRDTDAIRTSEFPVFASSISPNGPYRNGPGEINVPVNFDGSVIYPGDLVLGDSDGLVIVRENELDDVMKRAIALEQKEAETVQAIRSGTADYAWVDKKLQETGVTLG